MAVLPPDPIFVLKSPEMGPVNSICFHGNGSLVAGTTKGSVYLWNLQTNRISYCLEVGTNPIMSLFHSERELVSQEKGGRVKFWSMINSGYRLESSFEFDYTSFCRPDVIDSKNMLVIPQKENEICLFSLKTFEKCIVLPKPDIKLGHLSSLKAVNIDGRDYILAGYEAGNLLTWDLRFCKTIDQTNLGEIPISIDYDEDSNRGIIGGLGNKIKVYTYTKPSLKLNEKLEIGIKNAGINCLKIRKDQKVFASAGCDGRIRIFSWRTLRPLTVLTEHQSGSVMDIAFSSNSVVLWKAPIMAAAGADGKITLWDLYN